MVEEVVVSRDLDGPQKQMISVYVRDEKIVAAPMSLDRYGVWTTHGPIYDSSTKSSIESICEDILNSLALSRSTTALCSEDVDHFQPVVEAFGERSYPRFVDRMEGFVVEREGNDYSVFPLENRGAIYGFFHDRDKAVSLDSQTGNFGQLLANAVEEFL